ncbi:hypothetical protein LZ518_09970 [Sphingomonas sp. RB56-2]|uniref:Uncharacterized protein n=1 Tax=Sphingomonas brevis TaxID=2908206 RepID=A0ABT0SBE6_9SPHN|nr:hypothetical protein [Sphingomonas brevis]MCL6741457.1 hypothetical protein [Sphingomonas brevis]
MTTSGTSYDQLTMAELDERIGAGEITLGDLPKHLISAWAAWEPDPVPLTSFVLSDAAHREAFLYEYCAQGEPSLFTAVAHIWDSLAEPRELRCTLKGAACGSGGKGKVALVLMLRQFLDQFLEAGGPMPRAKDGQSIGEHHQLAMAHFDNMAAEEAALVKYYAAVLDGAAGLVAIKSGSPGAPSRRR